MINKKIYFNKHWEDIIASTNNCIAIIDDDVEETDKDEQANELNYHVKLIKTHLEKFNDLEIEIEKKASDVDKNMVSTQKLSARKRGKC